AHVAFTYDGETGTLRTWLRGQLAGETVFGPGDVDALAGDVGVGPAAEGAPSNPLFADGTVVVAIDELRVSRVARTKAEIERAAYFDPAPPPPAGAAPALPVGLDARDVRVPAGAVSTPDAVELGRKLFFDPRLSRDGRVSCATCHDP